MKTYLLKYWKPLAAVVFWGISFVATKIALEELLPLQIIFLRLVIGSSLLLLISIALRRSIALTGKNFIGILILALIAVFHLWIQVTGLQYTSATNTGWLVGTAPVFMAVMGYLFFKEKLSLFNLAGIFIAFAGLLLLISNGNLLSINFISSKGDLMVLSSSFTWGIYSMVNKKISLSYSPLLTVLYLFIVMGIIISPVTLSNDFFNTVINLSAGVWTAILYLGLFCSGLAYVFWSQSLRDIDAAKTGAFLYLEPFVTVLTAWIILQENITLLILFSGVVITAGVIMVNLKKPPALFQ